MQTNILRMNECVTTMVPTELNSKKSHCRVYLMLGRSSNGSKHPLLLHSFSISFFAAVVVFVFWGLFFCLLLLFSFEIGSHCVAQAGLA
jgi:hypothetical protein